MNRQGLGPGTGGSVQHPYFTHGGANKGYRCNLVAYNNGDGVVIMTNRDSGGQLASEILRSVAREYGWPDYQPVEHTMTTVDPKTLEGYVGTYQGANAAFTITRYVWMRIPAQIVHHGLGEKIGAVAQLTKEDLAFVFESKALEPRMAPATSDILHT